MDALFDTIFDNLPSREKFTFRCRYTVLVCSILEFQLKWLGCLSEYNIILESLCFLFLVASVFFSLHNIHNNVDGGEELFKINNPETRLRSAVLLFVPGISGILVLLMAGDFSQLFKSSKVPGNVYFCVSGNAIFTILARTHFLAAGLQLLFESAARGNSSVLGSSSHHSPTTPVRTTPARPKSKKNKNKNKKIPMVDEIIPMSDY